MILLITIGLPLSLSKSFMFFQIFLNFFVIITNYIFFRMKFKFIIIHYMRDLYLIVVFSFEFSAVIAVNNSFQSHFIINKYYFYEILNAANFFITTGVLRIILLSVSFYRIDNIKDDKCYQN